MTIHTADRCSGGGEAHEAHMALNGECPWDAKPEPEPEGFKVVCEDGRVRHAETFATRAEAVRWAEWGHACTSHHRVVPDGRCLVASIERCPLCQAEASYVADYGAPGIGQHWTCANGHDLVRLGGRFLDPRAYDDAEPPWVLTPEQCI